MSRCWHCLPFLLYLVLFESRGTFFKKSATTSLSKCSLILSEAFVQGPARLLVGVAALTKSTLPSEGGRHWSVDAEVDGVTVVEGGMVTVMENGGEVGVLCVL